MKKQNIFLGVDIGATKTIFLAVKFDAGKFQPNAGDPRAHKILEFVKSATPHKEPGILKMVEENFKSLEKKYGLAAIGIGFAGPVDFKRGEALLGPNLKTGKIEFKKVLERKLKVSVAVDNDARCFILAESIFGAAKGYKNIVGLTVGTGIGGGIIIDGKIYRGATGSVGEFGHTDILKSKELEEVASGSGLVNVYKKVSGERISSFKIIGLAKKKDKKALEAVNFNAESLGTGIANIIESFNPEIIVLGGGMAEVGLIVNKAKEYAKKKVFLPSLAKTPVVVSKIGQNAVALGAAWMASKEMEKRV